LTTSRGLGKNTPGNGGSLPTSLSKAGTLLMGNRSIRFMSCSMRVIARSSCPLARLRSSSWRSFKSLMASPLGSSPSRLSLNTSSAISRNLLTSSSKFLIFSFKELTLPTCLLCPTSKKEVLAAHVRGSASIILDPRPRST